MSSLKNSTYTMKVENSFSLLIFEELAYLQCEVEISYKTLFLISYVFPKIIFNLKLKHD